MTGFKKNKRKRCPSSVWWNGDCYLALVISSTQIQEGSVGPFPRCFEKHNLPGSSSHEGKKVDHRLKTAQSVNYHF